MQEMDQQAGKAQVYEADDVVREISDPRLRRP